ncbi:unnamed protein product [Leptosia nina]|uniref:Protein kinase domain-containing protein n=1 Tax=Leptosia nina TaxID=320188 RepID=A0AAV1JC84_9NEOP
MWLRSEVGRSSQGVGRYRNSVFKVIDFGSSCYEHQRVYTYIQSRFYRAPEVMMGAKYGMPIDMWSLGCILAELLTGFPLLPGEDEADQMACIIELLGMPPQRLIEQGKRSKNFISSKGLPRYCTATTLPDGSSVLSGGMSRRGKHRGLPGSKSFVTALKGCQDKYFIDFIRRCLEWEPEKRLTPAQALRHAWLRRRLPRPPHDEEPPANHWRKCDGGRRGGSGGRRSGGAWWFAAHPTRAHASHIQCVASRQSEIASSVVGGGEWSQRSERGQRTKWGRALLGKQASTFARAILAPAGSAPPCEGVVVRSAAARCPGADSA